MPEHLQRSIIELRGPQQWRVRRFEPGMDVANKRCPTNLAQGMTQGISYRAQHRRRVSTGLRDLQFIVADDQCTVRLDAAEDTNRLASAGFQGQLKVRRHTRFQTN